ncbi:hypothetical protein EG329_003218 [Mollisiaceae sp. DMI_Dod_QoI]|nr:hypothetical protein EG329_003218 [Helotiales sp. DMI_Dod_QoI]
MDEEPDGNGILRELLAEAGPASMDAKSVITVHGLHRTYSDTWLEEQSDGSPTSWLDELPRFSVGIRVLTYASTLNFSDQNILDKCTLHRAATAFLEAISKKVEAKKSLVFLCHNVGGVLVKEMLWIANHNKKYIDIACATRLLVFFGTPDVCSDWDDVLTRIVLATTDSSTTEGAKSRQAEIREVVRKGAATLKATSLRFQMINNQYDIMAISEGLPTAGIGIVVPPPKDGGTTIASETTHQQLCSLLGRSVLASVKNKIMEANTTAKKDYLRDLIDCRRRLAALCQCDETPGQVLLGTHSPEKESWFNEILERPPGIFVIYGGPGTGKTVLANQITLKAETFDNSITISFYFSLADYRRRTYRDLLLSFILQLLYLDDLSFQSAYVRKLCSPIEWSATPSSSDLHRLLFAILIRISTKTIFCVVDALDECDEATRSQLVGDFKRMGKSGLTSCRVVITSQMTDSIVALLSPLDENTRIDLEEKMKTVKGLLLTQVMNEDKLTGVRKELEIGNAPILKLKLLAHLASLGEILEIPKYVDYSQIYKRILARIDAPFEWLHNILLCVAFARRPMTISELAAAIGVDHTKPVNRVLQVHSLQHIRVLAPKQLQDDLKLVLGFLLRVENNVVHLIHHTLRDFIRELPNSIPWSTGFEPSQVDMVAPQSILLRKCLLFLSIQELYEIKMLPFTRRPLDTLCDPPVASAPESFWSYAGSCWPLHMLEGTQEETEFTKDCLSSLLDDAMSRNWWICKFVLEGTWVADSNLSDVSIIVLSSALGLVTVIKSLLPKYSGNGPELEKALSIATRQGHVEVVRVLLLHCAQTDDIWTKTLKNACTHGHSNLVRSILSLWTEHVSGIPPVDRDEVAECFKLATKYGHWPVISQLLESQPDWNEILKDRKLFMELLNLASKHGRDGMVSKLLDVQGTKEASEEKNDSGLSEALQAAAEFGSAAVIELLATLMDLESERPTGRLKLTSLHDSAFEGNTEVVEKLLDHGANIECQDDQDATPLLLACHAGQTDTARALLARGANPDHVAVRADRLRALHLAARNGNSALVQLLLESGASENVQLEKPDLMTPLHLVVEESNGEEKYLDTARALLSFNADVDAQTGDGSTPLHLAIGKEGDGAEALIRLLLDFDANIDKPDESGKSPLYYAVKTASKHARVLWDPTSRLGSRGMTVLFHAASRGMNERVSHLLEAGCDKEEQDAFGRTAFDVARTPAIRGLLAPLSASQDTLPALNDRCPRLSPTLIG